MRVSKTALKSRYSRFGLWDYPMARFGLLGQSSAGDICGSLMMVYDGDYVALASLVRDHMHESCVSAIAFCVVPRTCALNTRAVKGVRNQSE